MKTFCSAISTTILFVVLASCGSICKAQNQLAFVKAQNVNGYFQTSRGAVFTWSGSTVNSYCNGYGTIQFYDKNGDIGGKFTGTLKDGKSEGYGTMYYKNGAKSYEGYWVNDMRHGKGTEYHMDGSIKFTGNYIADNYEYLDEINVLSNKIATQILYKVFDGGQNLSVKPWTFTYDNQNGDFKLMIDMKFYGNIINTNYYQCTAILTKTFPYIDFSDYNDNAKTYILLKSPQLLRAIVDQLDKDLNKRKYLTAQN